ncbi:hypothetical protein DFS33DRAFT_1272855 [Desarmillaria ectypa]|nr:hypothetical protein DFS33DRAFT_1272855 [Desarmillaria ectypa]
MFLNTLAIFSLSACLPVVISAPVLDSNNTTTATSVFTSQNTTSTISTLSNFTSPLAFGVGVGHSPSGSEAVFVYSSQSSETTSSQVDSTPQRPLVMAYFPSWANDDFSPEAINYALYDWIDFAFAMPDRNFNLIWDEPEAPNLLERLVMAAHAEGTKVKLSIGGWTGSRYFSGAVSNEASRKVFASNICNIYDQYNLDGIDIDWEYPGHIGESGNQVSPSDSANFLQFLRLLRMLLPVDAVITAAVGHMPFVNDGGTPMKDASDFAQALDWILLMNYDVWSASPNPGPNAPLSDRCGNSTQPNANAQAAMNAWAAAGFKPYQLVLGIPAYGILSTSNVTGLHTRSKRGSPTLVANDDKTQGEIQFCSLVMQGALSVLKDASGQRDFVASAGFIRDWDQCSSTPFLRSPDTNQIVSYDDPESIRLKAGFVMENGMRGTSMWEMTGDTKHNDLINAVRKSIILATTTTQYIVDKVSRLPNDITIKKKFYPLYDKVFNYSLPSDRIIFKTSVWTPTNQYHQPINAGKVDTNIGPKNGSTALNDEWSRFYAGQITGWAGLIKVDNITYGFLGTPGGVASYVKATQKSAQRRMAFWEYFLSHDWTTTTTEDVVIHQAQLQAPSPFAEIDDRTQLKDGSVYYVTYALANMDTTYQTGADVDVRNQFINQGILSNTKDCNFRAIQDHWPVLAFAHDLGNISAATIYVVVAIGHIRDPAIQHIIADGMIQERSLYFLSQTTVANYIPSFLSDYTGAITKANNFDNTAESDASHISSDYADIVALSIRQAFAGTEITLSQSSNGSWNTGDILVFMKEISSVDMVNTVDAIFPAWPLFLYINPELGKYLLNAAFDYQVTGQCPNRYSVHDIGSHYPNATGHNDGKDEAMPVEESGNMIIMALNYAQKTGDTSQLTKYVRYYFSRPSNVLTSRLSVPQFDLLDQWAQCLISDTLLPSYQLSTNDFAGTFANQTNLAINGIGAMAKITDMTIASDYVSQWQNMAFSHDDSHLTLFVKYVFPAKPFLSLDVLLNKYSIETLLETKWYPTVANKYGVPLDTRHAYTLSVWEIWTAAVMTNNSTCDLFISSVKDWVSSGLSSHPFVDFYNATDGGVQSFKARPVVGGHRMYFPPSFVTEVAKSDTNSKGDPTGDNTTDTGTNAGGGSGGDENSTSSSNGKCGGDGDDDRADWACPSVLPPLALLLVLFALAFQLSQYL